MTDKKIKKPELVCPAGDWRSMITAVDSGADSVYFGIKGLNMRAKADNFDILQLPRIMDFLHQKNKKGYLTLNVLILDHQLEKMETILNKAKEAGVDAVVLWDMAVLAAAKEGQEGDRQDFILAFSNTFTWAIHPATAARIFSLSRLLNTYSYLRCTS